MDIGGGKGQEIETNIFGGTVGLIFDGRDRPITIPTNKEERLESIRSWSDALNEYPKLNEFYNGARIYTRFKSSSTLKNKKREKVADKGRGA